MQSWTRRGREDGKGAEDRKNRGEERIRKLDEAEREDGIGAGDRKNRREGRIRKLEETGREDGTGAGDKKNRREGRIRKLEEVEKIRQRHRRGLEQRRIKKKGKEEVIRRGKDEESDG